MLMVNTTSPKGAEKCNYGELQGDAWCSEKHVQIWIDNIDENQSLDDDSGSKTSSLSIPMSDDEMEIGADAHLYNKQKFVHSPRLSPLMPPSPLMPSDPPVPEKLLSASNLSAINTGNISDAGSSLREFNSKILEACKPTKTGNNILEGDQDERRVLRKQDSGSILSCESSFDNPSTLAAVLLPDPTEILINLGFGLGNDVSHLHGIPSRFLQQPSAVSGIDVESFQKGLIEGNASSDNTSVPRRFSSLSSFSCDSSSPLNAEFRRVLFKSAHTDMPSIHLSHDGDVCLSPSPPASMESAQRGRLSTLAEVPEPISRSNSFDDELSNEVAAAFSSELNVFGHKAYTNTSYDDNEIGMEEDNCALNNHICGMYTNLIIPSIKRTDSDKSISSSMTLVDREQLNIENTMTFNASLFKPITDGIRDTSPIQELDRPSSENSDDVCTKSASSRRTIFQNNSTSNVSLNAMHEDLKVLEKTVQDGVIDELVSGNNFCDDEGEMVDGMVKEHGLSAKDNVLVLPETLVTPHLTVGETVCDVMMVSEVGDAALSDVNVLEVRVDHEIMVAPDNVAKPHDFIVSDGSEVTHENAGTGEREGAGTVLNRYADDTVMTGVVTADLIDVMDEVIVEARMGDGMLLNEVISNDSCPVDPVDHTDETFRTNTSSNIDDGISGRCLIEAKDICEVGTVRTGSGSEPGDVRNVSNGENVEGMLEISPGYEVVEDTQKLIEEIKEILLLRPNTTISSVPDGNEFDNECDDELQMINDIRDILLKPVNVVTNRVRDYKDNVENVDNSEKYAVVNEEHDTVSSTFSYSGTQANLYIENVRNENCKLLPVDESNITGVNDVTSELSNSKIFELTEGDHGIKNEVSLLSDVRKPNETTMFNGITGDEIIESPLEKLRALSGCDTTTTNDESDKTNININTSTENIGSSGSAVVEGGDDVAEKDDDLRLETYPVVVPDDDQRLETYPIGVPELKVKLEPGFIETEGSENTMGVASMDLPSDFEKNAKFNEAFNEFFRKLKQESQSPIHNANVGEDSYENVDTNVDPPRETPLQDSLISEQDQRNPENKKSVKKNYLSAAFHSLTTALGKYQDSKQSKCSDDIVCSDKEQGSKQHVQEDHIDHSKDQKRKTKKKNFFDIFNHRTANLQASSTFPLLAANILEGKAEIDAVDNDRFMFTEVKDKANHSPSAHSQSAHMNRDCNEITENLYCNNCKVEQKFSSQSSIDHIPETLHGYIPDSPLSSDEHRCQSVRIRKKRTTKPLKKGVSIESSGFDEDTAKHKCPCGRKYHSATNIHSYFPSYHPDNVSKLPFAKEIERLMDETKCHLKRSSPKCDCGGNYYEFNSHGHFEYVIKQLTRVRTEINTHFDIQARRENDLKLMLNNQVSEMKQIMTSEYMGWILREMESLKSKLKEKDDEIEKLQESLEHYQ